MAACAAVEPELFTDGGEVAFMTKIIQQSAASPCRHRIKWFTCMVGIKADLSALKRACSAAGALHVRTTTFFQGQTLRWGLAWSFGRPCAKRALQHAQTEAAPVSDSICLPPLKRAIPLAALQEGHQQPPSPSPPPPPPT
jgi:23S rRNA A1618 N6-methylase RlmF